MTLNDKQKRITVVFRYDDFSSRSPTDIEDQLLRAFIKHHVPCTFGVIPSVVYRDTEDPEPQKVVPLTLEKGGILKGAINADILEVALHGYSHQTHCTYSEGGWTEFSGLDYEDQFKKIAQGKSQLEDMLDIQITTFIPPWNCYDLNTLLVLENLSFRTILAGRFGITKEHSRLKFLHSTCGLLDLRNAVKLARKINEPKPVIVVLFHAYEFI